MYLQPSAKWDNSNQICLLLTRVKKQGFELRQWQLKCSHFERHIFTKTKWKLLLSLNKYWSASNQSVWTGSLTIVSTQTQFSSIVGVTTLHSNDCRQTPHHSMNQTLHITLGYSAWKQQQVHVRCGQVGLCVELDGLKCLTDVHLANDIDFLQAKEVSRWHYDVSYPEPHVICEASIHQWRQVSRPTHDCRNGG